MKFILRDATPADAPAVAEIFLAARRAMTYLPALHSDDETRAFIAHVVATQKVIVAHHEENKENEKLDRVTGFAAINDHNTKTHLDHLYVDPLTQGNGIGLALLNAVKTQRPQGFALWCFQQNLGAERFYEREGLTLAKKTDGRDNEEKLPDMLYVWPNIKT